MRYKNGEGLTQPAIYTKYYFAPHIYPPHKLFFCAGSRADPYLHYSDYLKEFALI